MSAVRFYSTGLRYRWWIQTRRLRRVGQGGMLAGTSDDYAGAQVSRAGLVAATKYSVGGLKQATTKKAAVGLPTRSFRTPLADPGTITINRITPVNPSPQGRTVVTPRPVQHLAVEFLGVSRRLRIAVLL